MMVSDDSVDPLMIADDSVADDGSDVDCFLDDRCLADDYSRRVVI
jgi:hypothetical protein